MKTNDLRNCDGIGRDVLEERLRECAAIIDVMVWAHEHWGSLSDCQNPFAEAIAHFESLPGNRLPYTPPKLTQLDPLRLSEEQVRWAEELFRRMP